MSEQDDDVCPACGSRATHASREYHRPWITVINCRDCGHQWRELS